jgi:hypothetical protein
MKPYGLKHKKSKICECSMCGADRKISKKRERKRVKNELKKVEVVEDVTESIQKDA